MLIGAKKQDEAAEGRDHHHKKKHGRDADCRSKEQSRETA